MEEGRDQRVRFPCSYCKRNVNEFGCRCDESGRISRRQLQTLREKFFSEGSFNQEFGDLLFFQVLKYIIETGVPDITSINRRDATSIDTVYEAYARNNRTALIKQIYCERDRITIYLNLLFAFDRHVIDWSNNEYLTVNEDRRERRQNIFPLRLTLGSMNEIPVTMRISGRSFFWEDILQSLESGRTRLQWRCTFYERNGEPIEYESEHDHNGQFFTGMEDYAEDDADFERIVNMLADENQNVARRVPAEKSAVEKLLTVEIKDDCDIGMRCICQERMIEGDLAKKIACGHLYHGRCIIKWFTYSNFCPICKYALPSA
ncbi:hypothetical protein SUGI_0728830 [Cryptomeria japonica]|nr:hypothetical protein SUGI_0728830 [Cryptomeria japonica]